MAKQHKPLIVGNWKQNPTTLGKAQKLFLDIRKKLGTRKTGVEIVIAPPFPFIAPLEALAPSKRIELAAQSVAIEAEGAHTGEVAMSMLKSVGAKYVIVGHSERRAAGETDDMVHTQVQAVLAAKATVIVCVGEKKRDTQGHYFSVVEAQLKAALKGVKAVSLKHVVIAYEPIWAIGTGKTATPEDAQEMKIFIQKVISDLFSRTAPSKVRILYGGSVKKANAAELFAGSDVAGFLIGGASLKAGEFIGIVNAAETYAKS